MPSCSPDLPPFLWAWFLLGGLLISIALNCCSAASCLKRADIFFSNILRWSICFFWRLL